MNSADAIEGAHPNQNQNQKSGAGKDQRKGKDQKGYEAIVRLVRRNAFEVKLERRSSFYSSLPRTIHSYAVHLIVNKPVVHVSSFALISWTF